MLKIKTRTYCLMVGIKKYEEKIISEKKKFGPHLWGWRSRASFTTISSWKVEVSPFTQSGNYTSKSAQEISKKIVRYNFSLNNLFVIYKSFILYDFL